MLDVDATINEELGHWLAVAKMPKRWCPEVLSCLLWVLWQQVHGMGDCFDLFLIYPYYLTQCLNVEEFCVYPSTGSLSFWALYRVRSMSDACRFKPGIHFDKLWATFILAMYFMQWTVELVKPRCLVWFMFILRAEEQTRPTASTGVVFFWVALCVLAESAKVGVALVMHPMKDKLNIPDDVPCGKRHVGWHFAVSSHAWNGPRTTSKTCSENLARHFCRMQRSLDFLMVQLQSSLHVEARLAQSE